MTDDELDMRGEKAKSLLNDSMFKDAMEAVKKSLFEAWTDVPIRDVEGREWIFKMYQAQVRFENVFKGYVDAGKVAKHNLLEKPPKFKVFN